jgi:PST family polysaccharide transporter
MGMNVASSLSRFINKVRRPNDFVKNLGWFGIGQLVVRVTRILTTVVLARALSPHDYGLAAIVIAIYEFINVFNSVGITAKIVQADEKDLERLCNSGYWLNWIVYPCLCLFQCALSYPMALFYRDDSLILPICLLSLNYLVGPIGSIQGSLIRRENRLKIIAVGNSLQASVANILSAIFALLGFGMWAIILPKLIAFPINNLINLYNHQWRMKEKFTTKGWKEIFEFGINIVGICFLKFFRNNLDYLVVGRFLGLDNLGIYYFAFNAGLGISQTIITSVNAALFPYLCTLRSNFSSLKKGYFKAIRTIAMIIIPFVFFQTSLAPIYVPIVFGKEWISAIPILILICLSAIPRPLGDCATQLLLAVDKPRVSVGWDIAFTIIFMIALMIGVHWQVMGVALAVLISYFTFTPVFILWTNRFVFGSNYLKFSK